MVEFTDRRELEKYLSEQLEKTSDVQFMFGKRYKYLQNVQFSYSDFRLCRANIPSKKDTIERTYLLSLADESIEYFEKDRNTRRACFCNTKVSGHGNTKKNFGNCLVMFHLYVIDNSLEMNVYSRSLNFIKNLDYDLNTFIQIINVVAKKLVLKPRKINVHVFNLHAEEEFYEKKV